MARKFLTHLATFFQSVTAYVSDMEGVSVQDRVALRDKWETKGNRESSSDLGGNMMFSFRFSDFDYDSDDDDPYSSYLTAYENEKKNHKKKSLANSTGISVHLQSVS